MRRVFHGELQQLTYDKCMVKAPGPCTEGLEEAFNYGYENPEAKPMTPRCGLAGSAARAAWAAGVDCKRISDKLNSSLILKAGNYGKSTSR